MTKCTIDTYPVILPVIDRVAEVDRCLSHTMHSKAILLDNRQVATVASHNDHEQCIAYAHWSSFPK